MTYLNRFYQTKDDRGSDSILWSTYTCDYILKQWTQIPGFVFDCDKLTYNCFSSCSEGECMNESIDCGEWDTLSSVIFFL